ncbi:hypothetical protein J7337_005135 [Fusarium musae]|uniref:Uncharacterized protein n=1 Tax=Fusarium musae TaxID=1042133 RepID=A0A9P8DI56_9HYPO|nr:hypothetical protein J7337_005135 [Fusarium musae]KAG9502308.1 hypothetical protein J7337_005135 [Fusarium musae]
MENNDPHRAASDESNLDQHYFSYEISKGDRDWRSSQVDSVLSSFEEAKKVMSAQAIQEIHKYLISGRWIHDAPSASRHPAYKHIKGQSSGPNRGVPRLYYPYFFVLHAIFPPSESLRIVCEEVGRHWGLQVDLYKPFYPRLQDTEREMELIMGKNPHPRGQVERPSQSQYSSAAFTLTHDGNSEMEDQKDSIQVAVDTARTFQPVPTSTHDTLRDYDEELASIRSDFEQRLAKFQDSEQRIRQAQEKADEIHRYAVLAQQLFKKGQGHADAAVKIAESLLGTLNTAKRHVVVIPDDEGRPSKRLREN